MRALFLACALSCACSNGNGAPVAHDDAGAGDDGFNLPPEDVSFPDSPAGHVAARLRFCSGQESGCHSGGVADLRLGDGPAHDFAQVVNVRSTERPDLFRIEPGAPERSWLYLKVSNARDAGVETAMPRGTDGDPAFAAQLREWILLGAPTSL